MSTRMIGGVVMTHGDDAGLRLPPRMASVQVPAGRKLIADRMRAVPVLNMSHSFQSGAADSTYSHHVEIDGIWHESCLGSSKASAGRRSHDAVACSP